MALVTRLTERFRIRHPIVSAPMAVAGGGRLAAAVTAAGGLGLIGGGYGDSEWLTREFDAAGNQPVGCGFITWALAKRPALLDQALARGPRAIMLSFGDPRPFAPAIAAAGAALICQCQTIAHVDEAIEAGAEVVIAQGGEAGGHGMGRGLMSFVPEAADHLAHRAPDTILLAAGGIADGRGLAAAIMLGADGVLVGTRLWASDEALVHPGHHAAILATGGDGTIRSSTPDIARRLDWPTPFDIRVKRNAFTDRWHGRESELRAGIETEAPNYGAAFAAGDSENGGVVFGEAAGLIHAIEPARAIVERIAAEAEQRLTQSVRTT